MTKPMTLDEINKLHTKEADGTVVHTLTYPELNEYGEQEYKKGIAKGLDLAVEFLTRRVNELFLAKEDKAATLAREYAETLREEKDTQRKKNYFVR